MSEDEMRKLWSERLTKLSKQAAAAADYINTGGRLFDVNSTIEMDRDTPNTFEVGDFIVTDRFIRPKF